MSFVNGENFYIRQNFYSAGKLFYPIQCPIMKRNLLIKVTYVSFRCYHHHYFDKLRSEFLCVPNFSEIGEFFLQKS